MGALGTGGWALYHRDQIHNPGDFLRLAGEQLESVVPSRRAEWETGGGQVIRVASFNVAGLDQSRLSNPLVASILRNIIVQFDVVALQQVDAGDPWLVKRFLSEGGPQYQHFTNISGVAVRGDQDKSACNVIIYNRDTIELEGNRHYSVNDPDGLVHSKPQVAWFRTRPRGGEPAFTFSLVNLRIDPRSTGDEILQLGPVFRAVRGDGRGEDDVILAGDFGVPAAHLALPEIGRGLAPLVRYQTTTTAGDAQRDNLLVDSLATSEFTGEAGVVDFLKLHNLTLADARALSDHLPVWAEFSAVENFEPGRVARLNRPDRTRN